MRLRDRLTTCYQLLYFVYHATEGYLNRSIWTDEIANALGFDDLTIQSARKYLIDERLLSSKAIGGTCITYQGIDEIEHSIEHPESHTAHFPVYSIDSIEHGKRTIQVFDIKDIKDKRFQFLKKAYDLIEDEGYNFVNAFNISEFLNLDKSNGNILMKKIYEYLENKGLIKSIFSGGSFIVTNLGIRNIEFSDPKPLIYSKVDELIAGNRPAKYN